MRLAVVPNDVTLTGRFDARISLFQGKDANSSGTVGTHVASEFGRALGRAAPSRAWDLTALAMAVIAADRHLNRQAVSADGWTRQIQITVAVHEPDLWQDLRQRVEAMLRFLTGDLWSVGFIAGGFSPGVSARSRVSSRPETCVSLLSGGLDSLIGAIDLHADAERPIFVSNRVKGDCKKQQAYAAALGAAKVLSLNHNAKSAVPNPEISQRPRSLAFLAFGVLAATTLDSYLEGETVTLHVPENGFISLNVPLTNLRAGSLSTRTTHPIFIDHMQALFAALDMPIRLHNRYRHKTKGEMMTECADQAMLVRLAPSSMSCGRGGRIHRHCGVCLPCLVRRAAFFRHSGALDDPTTPTYQKPEQGIPFTAEGFSRYDDVMQCREALDVMDRQGARRWIGSAITAGRVTDPGPHRAVAERGLREIGTFLAAVGLD